MKYIVGALVAFVLAVIVAAGVIYFGGYNVAASDQHFGITKWVFHTTMERSVVARAGSVNAPAQLTQEQADKGFSDFSEMCVTCHGAPGKERGEIGKGLNPQAPDLARSAQQWSNGELYWIVKNGVKMTGMPAFGFTHSDERLWAIVAFVKQLPRMTPEQYAQMEKAASMSPEQSHGHSGADEQKH